MTHCRRGFYDAQTSDQLRSLIALSFIKLLYRVEEEARGLDPPARRALRQEKAKPWLGEFKTWLEAQRGEVLPKSPFGEASYYALAQWTALERYLDVSQTPGGSVKHTTTTLLVSSTGSKPKQ